MNKRNNIEYHFITIVIQQVFDRSNKMWWVELAKGKVNGRRLNYDSNKYMVKRLKLLFFMDHLNNSIFFLESINNIKVYPYLTFTFKMVFGMNKNV